MTRAPMQTVSRLALLAAAAGAVPAVHAQSTPPEMIVSALGGVGWAGRQVQDFIVPNQVGASVRLVIKGADGGNLHANRKHWSGGQGATVTLDTLVGHAEGMLKPGGRIRYIIGESGERARGKYGGGGGGGSAIFYDPDNDQQNWVVLAVGGAGGGAWGVDRKENGVNASVTTTGARADHGEDSRWSPWGGLNGNGGDHMAAGGGLYTDGARQYVVQEETGHAGFPNGANGGTNGNDGGWGAGSGGSGIDTDYRCAGGGGGYSGGGAGFGTAGGGGGSYVNDTYGPASIFVGNDGHWGSGSYQITPLSALSSSEYLDLGVVQLDGSASMTTNNSNFDTTLTLYDALGNVLATDDDAAGNKNALITQDLLPGDYYIAVAGYPNFGSDAFQVPSFEGFGGNYEVTVGETVRTGALASGDYQFVKFTVGSRPTDATDLGVVGLAGTTEFDLSGSDFDTVLGLYGADGKLITWVDDGGPNFTSRLSYDLPAGTYHMMVTGFSATPADYYARTGSNFAHGTIGGTINDTAVSGSFLPGEYRMYKFTLNDPPQFARELGELGSTGPFTFSAQGSGFSANLAIYDDAGKLLHVSENIADPTAPSQLNTTLTAGSYHAAIMADPSIPMDYFSKSESQAPVVGGQYTTTIGPVSFATSSLGTDETIYIQFQIIDRCNAADVATPFGALDLADVQTFLIAFGLGESAADIAPQGAPDGVYDLSDVQTFLIAFGAGCP